MLSVSVMVQVIDETIVKVFSYRLIHIPEEEKASDLVNLLVAKLKVDKIYNQVKKNIGEHP